MRKKQIFRNNYLCQSLILFFLSFSIVYLFSLSKNPHSDEAVSIFCSLYYLTDCIYWEVHFPTYYYFIFPLVNLIGKVEIMRIFSSIITSFTVLVGIKSIEIFRRLNFIEKIIGTLILSFIPSVYSASSLRPYNLMLFFSAVSFYYFLISIKKDKVEEGYIKKSLLFDNISAFFFPFSFLNVFIKNLYILITKKMKIKELIRINLVNFIFLSFLGSFFTLTSVFRVVKAEDIIRWYENFKNYYFRVYLPTFPVELYKDFSAVDIQAKISSNPIIRISVLIIQILFFYPFISLVYSSEKMKRELVFLYFLFFFMTFLVNLSIGIYTSKYFITSRQFLSFSFPLIILLLVLLEDKFYVAAALPIFYVFSTIFIFRSIFLCNCLFGPHLLVYEKIPENSTVLIHPFWESINFWYFETFSKKKNLTLVDVTRENWFNEDILNITFRIRRTDRRFDYPYEYRKIENLDNLIKIFLLSHDRRLIENMCKSWKEEIRVMEHSAVICK